MRPGRLVLEGFGPFRERVEVDFTDTELFALVGPTGAGKSSVIDGITFALYGSVARYGDERLIAPVINQRCPSAVVDLVFTVGETEYRVHRQAVRTRTGATVKEARLERGDEVLASGKGVSAAVEELLGLSFSQFTTCVVLPQGDFARFLHETPGNRETLLKKLLDLGVYDRVGQAARARAANAAAQMELLDRQLTELRSGVGPDADPEALSARVAALEALLAQIEAAQPELKLIGDRIDEARAQLDLVQSWVALLSAVVAPADLDSVAELIATSDLELRAAETARVEAEQQLEAVEATATELTDRVALEAARERGGRLADLARRIAQGEEKTAAAADTLAASQAARTEARATRDTAAAEVARVEREHAAHALAGSLQVGEPCPVCLHPVETLPDHDLGDLERVRAALAEADERLRVAEARATDDETNHHRFLTLLESLVHDREALQRESAADPSADEIEAVLGAWAAYDQALAGARSALQVARDQEKEANARRHKAQKVMDNAWGRFDDVRDPVGGLEPPSVDRRDLAGSWAALLTWASDEREKWENQVTAAQEVADQATAMRDERLRAIAAACDAAGLDVAGRPPRDVVVDTLAATRTEAERAADRRADLARRLDERDACEATRQVADALGGALRAGGFVSWLLAETVQELLAGATARLQALSHDRYSLAVDDKNSFCVIDHTNADERRLARTLSGGETFLASLALALALADEVARLSAAGAPRLESIFLDEGFGTLDPESLDVVVSAIEDLQASGRLVGLVSHVGEIAERVPVRFEVTKAATTSTVERVVV